VNPPVQGQKINLQGARAYCGGLPHHLFYYDIVHIYNLIQWVTIGHCHWAKVEFCSWQAKAGRNLSVVR